MKRLIQLLILLLIAPLPAFALSERGDIGAISSAFLVGSLIAGVVKWEISRRRAQLVWNVVKRIVTVGAIEFAFPVVWLAAVLGIRGSGDFVFYAFPFVALAANWVTLVKKEVSWWMQMLVCGLIACFFPLVGFAVLHLTYPFLYVLFGG